MARLDKLFTMVKERSGSDLHLSVGVPPIIRIHGDLERVSNTPLPVDETKSLLYEIMAPAQIKRFEETHDLDFSYQLDGVARFRANIFMQNRGVGAVFRIIPSRIVTAEELHLPQGIINMARFKKGLVAVTGPTGSGKSTTLAALLDWINTSRKEHILTMEDPIEFVHTPKQSLINQRELGAHTESFAAALKAALREDPDVILVGEMRDPETISLALTAAETGHLVFGTLHTSSAAKTVDRIIDVFPGDQQGQVRSMLAESMKGVVAQVLLKKVGGGRIAVHEILVGNAACANMIREGKIHQIPSLMQTSRKEGMQTMDQCLEDALNKGLITARDAYDFAVDKKRFETMAIAA